LSSPKISVDLKELLGKELNFLLEVYTAPSAKIESNFDVKKDEVHVLHIGSSEESKEETKVLSIGI
jgi:hypothetical protein